VGASPLFNHRRVRGLEVRIDHRSSQQVQRTGIRDSDNVFVKQTRNGDVRPAQDGTGASPIQQAAAGHELTHPAEPAPSAQTIQQCERVATRNKQDLRRGQASDRAVRHVDPGVDVEVSALRQLSGQPIVDRRLGVAFTQSIRPADDTSAHREELVPQPLLISRAAATTDKHRPAHRARLPQAAGPDDHHQPSMTGPIT
jgi:hypothetical protein